MNMQTSFKTMQDAAFPVMCNVLKRSKQTQQKQENL